MIFHLKLVWKKSEQLFGRYTEVKGQNRSFLAKFIIFCVFFIYKKQYMYWNWCMILLCQSSFKWYPFGEDQYNFWTAYGGQRSKNGHFRQNLPFSVIFFCVSNRICTRTGVYYCCFNQLLCITSWEKIKIIFGMVYRGQRSKKVTFGETRHFSI